MEELLRLGFFLLRDGEELVERSRAGVLLRELPGDFFAVILSVDSLEGDGLKFRFEGLGERM